VGVAGFAVENAILRDLPFEDAHQAAAAGSAAAALGAQGLGGKLGGVQDGGPIGNERGSSGGREGDLMTGHLRIIHSALGLDPPRRGGLKDSGDVSGAMEDTYNLNSAFHFAVVDDVVAYGVTSQTPPDFVPFPARSGHPKESGEALRDGVDDTIGRTLAPFLSDINPNVIEVGSGR
jgi:hypothetical protein